METAIALIACVSFVVWLAYPAGAAGAEDGRPADSFSSFPPERFDNASRHEPHDHDGVVDLRDHALTKEIGPCAKL